MRPAAFRSTPLRRPLARKTGVGQFAPAPYTRTAPVLAQETRSVNSDGDMPSHASGQMNS